MEFFLDDLNHSSLQTVTTHLELATPGHLGAEVDEQIATANLLSLNLLSSRFRVEVRPVGQTAVPKHWQQGFDFIQNQICNQLGNSAEEEEDAKLLIKGHSMLLRLSRWQSIHTIVYDMSVEVHSTPSMAALWDDTVAITGEPRDFAIELCRVLCDYWGLRRRHDLPEILPELAIRITEISDQSAVATWITDDSNLNEVETEEKQPITSLGVKESLQGQKATGPSALNVATCTENTNTDNTNTDNKHPSSDQNYDRRPKRSRLLSYVVSQNDFNEEPPDTHAAERRSQIDEAGIKRVKEHEEEANREPEVMPHHNEGYDIKSYDEDGRLARYIEVKSLSGNWDIDNVKVTHSQFEHATEIGERYWLYVVERAESESYQIHCIQNPALQVTHFIFDNGWIGLLERNE